jgi:hypothetical protein
MRVVYHGVPKAMAGHVLYPLGQLQAVAPAAYEFQRSKYAGRESVLSYRIPRLGVLFNDTDPLAASDTSTDARTGQGLRSRPLTHADPYPMRK